MTRKSEGTALLEIEHYKADNERLVHMLSQTQEYKTFGTFALDSISDGFSGGLRYMNPVMKTQYSSSTCHPNKKKILNDFKAEKEDWIPEEAFKVAHDFRNKCASNVPQSLMNQMLSDLNKIWRSRE